MCVIISSLKRTTCKLDGTEENVFLNSARSERSVVAYLSEPGIRGLWETALTHL